MWAPGVMDRLCLPSGTKSPPKRTESALCMLVAVCLGGRARCVCCGRLLDILRVTTRAQAVANSVGESAPQPAWSLSLWMCVVCLKLNEQLDIYCIIVIDIEL